MHRKRMRMKNGNDGVLRVKPSDILWWASLNPTTALFTDAAKKIRAAKCEVEVLWPKSATSLIVRELSGGSEAVRKRSRRS